MLSQFPINSCRWRPWCALLMLLAALACLEEAANALVVDDFEDGSWNVGGHWGQFIAQGGVNLDAIGFDETATSGILTSRYTNSGSGDQTTMILRDDVTLAVGQWVQMDVAIMTGPRNEKVRVGLTLAARRAPGRANVLYWGLRHDGLVRGHYYGAQGTEIEDARARWTYAQQDAKGIIGRNSTDLLAQAEVPYYRAGFWFTIAVRRTTTAKYDLFYARTGSDLTLSRTYEYSGSTGAGETPPVIPGLLLDNGQASFTAAIDNFEVGSKWPPPVHPAKPFPPLPTPEKVSLITPNNIFDLPHASSTRHVVQMPRGDGDYTYHHGALIESWKGKLYCAWQSTQRSEHTPPYEARVSVSTDGESWSVPVKPAAPGDAAYVTYLKQKKGKGIAAGESIIVNSVPRAFLPTPDKLYLWCLGWITSSSHGRDRAGRIFWTDDGVNWNEIPPLELDRLEAQQGLRVRNAGSNCGFIPLRDGRLMAAAMEGRQGNNRMLAPITSDPTGLIGWTGGWVDTSDFADVGEPSGWEGPDGVLHYTARNWEHIWHSFSRDQGNTWSKLTEQPDFHDNPGNKDFGLFPNGWVWYVGGPAEGSRIPLVLGISRDGWTFDQNYLVRWEQITPIWRSNYGKSEDRPGWEYPTAVYRDGYLYVAYSRTRDFIEVSKVDLRSVIPPIDRIR